VIQLLAVDDPGLLLALQPTFVRRVGWRVLTARDTADALARAREVRPDLIVLDADGWGAECRRMLELDAELVETPVVLLASAPGAVSATSPHAAVVRRPIERSALLSAIRRFIVVPERSTPRRRTSRPVKYFREDDERTGSTKDVGIEGLFLRCAPPPAVGESVRVVFDLPHADQPTIRAKARVVRVIEPERDSHLVAGAGLRFVELSAADRAELSAFVGAGE